MPDRPQYVVLCNFDEFWVYDFNTQLDSPKDKVNLAELATRWGPLAFLFPTNEAPTFGNDREAVTREAADKLAECFRKLVTRKVDRGLAQRFILQTLVTPPRRGHRPAPALPSPAARNRPTTATCSTACSTR